MLLFNYFRVEWSAVVHTVVARNFSEWLGVAPQ